MKHRSLLILSALVLLFASCGNKSGNSGLMVPKDAGIVIHVNSPSLSSKLSWDEIRQTNWFREISKEHTDTMAAQLLANPASSGVDTKADMVFYIKKHGRGSYLIFAGSLTDAGAFEKLCKGLHTKGEVKKDGDFSYMSSPDHGSVVWNKSHFAYAANAPVPDMNNIMDRSKPSHTRNGFPADSLRILGIEALSLKNSDNLDKDDRFSSLIKDGSDVHVWMNLGQYYSGMGGGAMLSMMKLNTLLEDNVTAMSLNFENGRISAKAKHYYGDKMNSIQANNRPEAVSADVLNRIPSTNVVAVLAFNYSPKALKEVLKMTGIDAMADMFLAKVDFSIDEFVKANKGELLLAVSDLGKATKIDTIKMENGKTSTHSSAKPDMKFLFATSVNDKASFEKMVTLAWDLSKKIRQGDDKPAISYKLENNWFAASNSADYKDQFLAGGNNKLPFVDKITGHPIGVYVDLQKILQFAGSMAKDDSSGKAAAVSASLNMWQDIVAKGGDYKDKATEFEFEINLVDKNTNSLKQLNQYIDKLASIKKERMGGWKMRETTIEDIKVAPSIALQKGRKK